MARTESKPASLSPLIMFVLLVFSTSGSLGQNLDVPARCRRIELTDYASFWTTNDPLAEKVGCSGGPGDSCSLVIRGRSSILRKTNALCIMGNYHLYCDDDSYHFMTISSSLDTVELPCNTGNPSINVCAPPNEDLTITFNSETICTGPWRAWDVVTPFGTLGVNQTRFYSEHTLYLTRTHDCISPRAISTSSAVIASSYEEGDPERMYYCDAYVHLPVGTNKLCMRAVEFNTHQGGAALKVEGHGLNLIFNAANPMPEHQEICFVVPEGDYDYRTVHFTLEPNHDWELHSFIIYFNGHHEDSTRDGSQLRLSRPNNNFNNNTNIHNNNNINHNNSSRRTL